MKEPALSWFIGKGEMIMNQHLLTVDYLALQEVQLLI